MARAVEGHSPKPSMASRGSSDGSVSKAGAAPQPFFMLQEWNPSTYGVAIEVIAELFDTLPAFQSYKVEVANAGKK